MKDKICISVSILLYVAIMISAAMYANADEYDEIVEKETDYDDYNIQCEDVYEEIYDGSDDEFANDFLPNLEESVEEQSEYIYDAEIVDEMGETESDTEEHTEKFADPESNAAIVGETEDVSEPVENNRIAYIGTTINIDPEEYADDYCDLELYITLSKYGVGVIESFSSITDSTYEISNLSPGKYYVAVDVYENSKLKLTSITMSDDGILDLESDESAYVEVTATYKIIVPETEKTEEVITTEHETIIDSPSESVHKDINAHTDTATINSTAPETIADDHTIQHTHIPLFIRILIALVKSIS